MSETLVTLADYRAVKGVVEVRDCDPDPGHVTLVTAPGNEGWVREQIDGRTIVNLQVHIVSTAT